MQLTLKVGEMPKAATVDELLQWNSNMCIWEVVHPSVSCTDILLFTVSYNYGMRLFPSKSLPTPLHCTLFILLILFAVCIGLYFFICLYLETYLAHSAILKLNWNELFTSSGVLYHLYSSRATDVLPHKPHQGPTNVVSNSPGLVDFPSGKQISSVTCPTAKPDWNIS